MSTPNLLRRDWNLISSGHSPEKEADEPKKTGPKIWAGLDDASVCYSVSFLPLSLTVCQLSECLLRSLIWLISIAFHQGVIIAQLSRQRYKGSIAWGVLCSAFFHNNNNGVRELSDPRSFWGWHIRLRYSRSPSLPSLPPPHTLYGSLSPIHRATCHTPSLNTPIDVRGDEVVGVQLQSSSAGDNCTL